MTTATAEHSADATTDSTLHIPGGLVGLPQAERFTLTGGADGVFELASTDDEGLGFVVVAPGPFFPDYSPTIDDTTASTIGLEHAEDALVLLVVTLGDQDTPPHANLMAPIVVNAATRTAAQVVLADQGYSLRAPFLV